MLIFIAITAFFVVGVSYNLYQSHKESQIKEQQTLEMDLDAPPISKNEIEV